ncbi:hypothetical protein HPB49_018629 [Dermacentor silvarum]|uniref:Uncharacterized protein n=1 Tax=Dermacentor silvarum TaxID=543639 RepID=A0ACB8DK41_DERSI|nr:hypothetical protein HPB49_018629 [Dermacentor silvarum]
MADETPKEDSKSKQLSEAEKDDAGTSKRERCELKSPPKAAPEASSPDAEQFAGFSWTSPEEYLTVPNEESRPKPAAVQDTGSSEISPQKLAEKSTVASDHSAPTTEAPFARSSATSAAKSEGQPTAATSDQSSPKSAEKIPERKSDMTSHESTAEPAGREEMTAVDGTSPRESTQKSPIYSSDAAVSKFAEERGAASTPKPAGKHHTKPTATSPMKSAEKSIAPDDLSASKISEEQTTSLTVITPLRSILKSGKISEACSPKLYEKQDIVSTGTSPRKYASMSPTSSDHSHYKRAKDRTTRSFATSPMMSIEKTTKPREESSNKLWEKRDARSLPTSPNKSTDTAVVKAPTDRVVDTYASEAVSAGKHRGAHIKPSMRSVGTSPIDWPDRTPAESPYRATSNDATGVDSDVLDNYKRISSLVRERNSQQQTVRMVVANRLVVAGLLSALAFVLSVRMMKVAHYTDVVTMEGTLVGLLVRSSQGVAVRRFLGVPYAKSTTGEWFETGSNSDHDWTELAALADCVVVSVNHRLGVMGFFKPDLSDAVYDVAFKDLQLAVDWTRRNAGALDGDPDALMALGHGSGAFMLAVTMISREHHVGFKRMLLQGLYPTMPLSLNTPSMGRGYMHSMTTFLGCQSGDPSALLSCLREASQEQLLRAVRHINIPLRFVPTRFEGYRVGDISDHDVWKFDADVDIILGSALSLGEAFNDQYLLPYAARQKIPYDPVHTLRSVCLFLKERACTIRGGANRTQAAQSVEGMTEQQLEEYMAHLWTTCASRAMADVAVLKNATVRHYATATSGGLFDPPLTLADVAAFFKAGAVPPLRSGLPWPVYERGGVSRSDLWPNSSEETIGAAANEICSKTRAFAHYLY